MVAPLQASEHRFTVLGKIGEGRYSELYKVQRSDGRCCAMKIVKVCVCVSLCFLSVCASLSSAHSACAPADLRDVCEGAQRLPQRGSHTQRTRLFSLSISALARLPRRLLMSLLSSAPSPFPQSLRHPNIIQCFGSFLENNVLYIVLELAEAGDLQRFISAMCKKRIRFAEVDIW